MSRNNNNRFAALLADDESAPNSPDVATAPAPVPVDTIPVVDISGAALSVQISSPPPTPEPELTEEEKAAIEEQRKHDEYMEEHYYKPEREARKKAYEEYMLAYFDSPTYWETRLASLETQRWKYVKKRAWSAEDMFEVDRLDADIKEARDALAAFAITEEDEYECGEEEVF